MKVLASLVLIPCILITQACTPSNAVVLSLKAIMAAAEQYSAISGDPLIAPYINQVAMATTETITELQSTDTPLVKALKITEKFADIAVPDLALVSPPAAAIVLSVDAAIHVLLVILKRAHSKSGVAYAAAFPAKFKLTHADTASLGDLKHRAVTLSNKCADDLNSHR